MIGKEKVVRTNISYKIQITCDKPAFDWNAINTKLYKISTNDNTQVSDDTVIKFHTFLRVNWGEWKRDLAGNEGLEKKVDEK